MQLTYSGHTHSHVVVELADGETLGELTGPIGTMVPVDGGNPTYAEIYAQNLPIESPVAGITPPIWAQAAEQEQLAEEHRQRVAQDQADAGVSPQVAESEQQQAYPPQGYQGQAPTGYPPRQ
jgi:hypothetical protein